MEILKGFFDDLQSKTVYLSHTGTKRIQVCLDPEKLPNMVAVYKLISHDHNCHITFSKKTMNAIVKKSRKIKRCLIEEEEKLFLLNDELKVFSERMHNNCAVCFLNFQGVRINMMIGTFSKMICTSDYIYSMHTGIHQRLQKSAKNLKQLFEAQIAKYVQCNANNPEYHGFLQQLHQCVSTLGQGGFTVSDTSDDMDSDDDDEDVDLDEYDSGSYDKYRNRPERRHNPYDDYYDDYDEDTDDY